MIDEILEFTRAAPPPAPAASSGGAGGQAAAGPGAGPAEPRHHLRCATSRGSGVRRRGPHAARDDQHREQRPRTPMESGGTFLVRSRGRNARVEIDLADDGHGIPEDLRVAHLRAASSPTASRAGIGLGMSITRKIVEGTAGRIRLDSQVGRGTTFTVSLPVDRAAPAEPSSGRPPRRAPGLLIGGETGQWTTGPLARPPRHRGRARDQGRELLPHPVVPDERGVRGQPRRRRGGHLITAAGTISARSRAWVRASRPSCASWSRRAGARITEELLSEVPRSLLDLLKVPGLGPEG